MRSLALTRLAAIPAPHLLAAALCAGLALALGVRLTSPAVGAATVVLASLALATERWRAALLATALLAAGCWWGSVRLEAIDESPMSRAIGSSVFLRAQVTGPTRRGPFTLRTPVTVQQFDGAEIDEPAQLELPASERAPPQGAVLEVAARVRAPRIPTESSSFDEAAYLRRHGMHVVLRADGYRIVGRRGGLGGVADRVRAGLSGSIAPGLQGERRALVAGIVLGEDEGLEADLRDRFRASGLYHLLAVSGQNVAYVVAGVLIAGWLLGVSRWWSQAVAILAILGYVLAVGWQPSVVRAGIAGGLASLAWLASRASDRWYFLLVGGAALLAWSPYNLLDPGFQLSFSAVAAIFVLVPRLERRLEGYPVPSRLATVVAVSAGCGVATAPILWLHFGAVPILSVLANALAAPVVAPILGFGLAAAAVGTVLPGAALSLAWLNGWLVAYLAACARLVGGLPFAQVESGLVLGALVGLIAFVAVLRRAPRSWRRPALATALAIAALVAGWKLWPRPPALPPPTGLRISFLDVGQGDSALLQVPQGAVLVDQGPPEARVAARLGRLGVRKLAVLVLTHPQRDHIGGAADVLRRVEVGSVLDPLQPNESPYEDEALDAARDRGVRLIAARAGGMLRLGNLRLRVLWPDGPGLPGEDPNRHPIVLLASYGRVDALLTADAESEVTGALPLPRVEILKVAHHGSEDPGLRGLLERLQPRIAVVSVGADNDYGHPAPPTLAALEASPELRLYRTDRDGTVVVESDGGAMTVRTEE
jgi:competence protein ComEC